MEEAKTIRELAELLVWNFFTEDVKSLDKNDEKIWKLFLNDEKESIDMAEQLLDSFLKQKAEQIKAYCIDNHDHYPEYDEKYGKLYPSVENIKANPLAGKPITDNFKLFEFLDKTLTK